MQEVCQNLKKSDRMMAVVLVFKEDVLRLICVYGHLAERSVCEKDQFCNQISCEWELQTR